MCISKKKTKKSEYLSKTTAHPKSLATFSHALARTYALVMEGINCALLKQTIIPQNILNPFK